MKINLANIDIPKDIFFDEIDGNLEIKLKNSTYNKFTEFIILIGVLSFAAIITYSFSKNFFIVALIVAGIIAFLMLNLSAEEPIGILIKDGILIKEEPGEAVVQIGVKKEEQLPKTRTHHLIEIEKIASLTIMKYEKKYFLNLIDIDNNKIFIVAHSKEENILTIKKILESYI